MEELDNYFEDDFEEYTDVVSENFLAGDMHYFEGKFKTKISEIFTIYNWHHQINITDEYTDFIK